jgi:Superinfection immunity protein
MGMGNANEMYQPRTSTAMMVIAWIAAVLTSLYMLPWAVAVTRGKSNATAIGLINLLLGWTVIGWIVALVMACMPHKELEAYR